MICADALAPFGPGATACLLPHFTTGPDGIRTLGGRRIPVDPAAADLAAALAVETAVASLPLDEPATAHAFAQLCEAGIATMLPAGGDQAAAPVEAVILSPHVDDAALSVGAQMAARRGHGRRQLVCNIFSDQSYQTGLRVPGSALDEVARAEDRLAGRILGYESRELAFSGAQDRHGLSLAQTLGWNRETVCAEPLLAGEISTLADCLAAVLAEPACRSAPVLAPSGIGGHLDHVLVALATEELLAARVLEPARITFYEDLPYAAGMPGLPQGDFPRPIRASLNALTLKLAALAVFRTRLRTPQIALCKARALDLGGDGLPVEMTFEAAGAGRLQMDSSRRVGSMAT
jgi:LmbE family N-acetylglucosaminyl deacetylase